MFYAKHIGPRHCKVTLRSQYATVGLREVRHRLLVPLLTLHPKLAGVKVHAQGQEVTARGEVCDLD